MKHFQGKSQMATMFSRWQHVSSFDIIGEIGTQFLGNT